MSDIERIKDAIDLVSYIQRHVPALKKAGRTYEACCPFHSEKHASFKVNPETQQWRCYGSCATGGDLFSFAQKFHNWSFNEALEHLAQEAGVTLQRSAARREDRETHERLIGLLNTAADMYTAHLYADTPASRAALAYARETRGLTDETLKAFRVGYAPDQWSWLKDQLVQIGYSAKDLMTVGLIKAKDEDDKEGKGHTYDVFRHRLMFPIIDADGVHGFGGRAMGEQEPKYLNSKQSPVFDKSRLLYALPSAVRAIESAGEAVIVEGFMDAVQAHQAGHRNTVAQMGTALTDGQLQRLSKHTKRILLALDQDAPGQAAQHRALTDLYSGGHVSRLEMDMRVVSWQGYKDPDDVIRTSPDAWNTALKGSQNALETLLQAACANIPHDASIAQKQAVLRGLSGVLGGLDVLLRRDAFDRLAARLGLREGDVSAWWQMQSSLKAAPAAAPQSVAPAFAPLPVLELQVLHGILVNDDQRWIDRVNARLAQYGPYPHALAPLSLNDFTHTHTRALMSMIARAMEGHRRPVDEDVYEQVNGGPLFEAYERATLSPVVQALFAMEKKVYPPFVMTYDTFVKAAVLLRRVRLDSDLASQMLTNEQIVEWVQAKMALARPMPTATPPSARWSAAGPR